MHSAGAEYLRQKLDCGGVKMQKAEESQPRKIMLSNSFYIVDNQLQRFRRVLDPSEYIDFDSPEGQEVCDEFGVARSSREKKTAEVQV